MAARDPCRTAVGGHGRTPQTQTPRSAIRQVRPPDAPRALWRGQSMTAVPAPAAPTTWESAKRSRIRAFRAGPYLLILAEGELPNPGYEVDIRRSPLRIFPPQFNLLWRQRPAMWPQVVVPYRYGEVFRYPTDEPTVTVHHADG